MKIIHKNETKEFKNSDKCIAIKYSLGDSFFEKLFEFLEDWEDTRAIKSIKKSDWGNGKSLDKVAKELGIKI